MTQTPTLPLGSTKPPVLPFVLYRVYGKDRLSDPWTTFESHFRWEAEQWASVRAFTRWDLEGDLVVEQRQPGLARLEWFRNGAWEAYTAYESYERAVAALASQAKHNPANRFRIAEALPSGE